MERLKQFAEFLWLHKETVVAFVVLVWQALEHVGVIHAAM